MSDDNVIQLPVRASKRLNLALIPKAEASLERVRAHTGHTQTDALNRGVQLLDLVLTRTEAGDKLAFVKPDGTVEVVIIV